MKLFKESVFFEKFLFVYLLGIGLGIYGKNNARLLCKKELLCIMCMEKDDFLS